MQGPGQDLLVRIEAVRLDHQCAGLHVALLDLRGEVNLLLDRQKRSLADLTEVDFES